MIFLIDYDRPTGTLVRFQTYPDAERRQAEDDRLALELQQHRDGISREVVILEASSEERIRMSHRRYFETVEQILEAFLAAAA